MVECRQHKYDKQSYNGSKRHRLQAGPSQRIQTAVHIVSKPPALSIGGPIYHFCVQAGRMVGAALHKSG